MNYLVVDLETANPDYSSICQMGIVVVRDGSIVDELSILIDPNDYFDPWNISIHGIDPTIVAGCPKFDAFHQKITQLFANSIVLHHGPFDRIAINRACDRYGLPHIEAFWLDNQQIVRRSWEQFSRSGYALKKLARHFNIEFKHHDALEDARATQQIFKLAMEATGLGAADWLERVKQPSSTTAASKLTRTGDLGGDFSGDTIVFTGSLEVQRSKAANVAQSLGFDVANSVTKKTTYLCVGIQDRDKLAGYEKSSKHRKANKLVGEGQDITIISEVDFWALSEA